MGKTIEATQGEALIVDEEMLEVARLLGCPDLWIRGYRVAARKGNATLYETSRANIQEEILRGARRQCPNLYEAAMAALIHMVAEGGS
jgi:hypothetical protein